MKLHRVGDRGDRRHVSRSTDEEKGSNPLFCRAHFTNSIPRSLKDTRRRIRLAIRHWSSGHEGTQAVEGNFVCVFRANTKTLSLTRLFSTSYKKVFRVHCTNI